MLQPKFLSGCEVTGSFASDIFGYYILHMTTDGWVAPTGHVQSLVMVWVGEVISVKSNTGTFVVMMGC